MYGRIAAGPRTPAPTSVTVEIAQYWPPPPHEPARGGRWDPFFNAGGSPVGPDGTYRARLTRAMIRPTDSIVTRLRLRPGDGVYPVRARPQFMGRCAPEDSTRVDLALP